MLLRYRQITYQDVAAAELEDAGPAKIFIARWVQTQMLIPFG